MPEPVAAPAPPALSPAITAACSNELGLYCAEVKGKVKETLECLEENLYSLMPGCKAALREKP